jgi:hypothetical protein
VSSPKQEDIASNVSSCTSTNLEPDFDFPKLDLSTIKSEGMFSNIHSLYISINLESSEFFCPFMLFVCTEN